MALDRQNATLITRELCPWLIGKVDSFLQFIFTGAIKFNSTEEIAQYACVQVNVGQIVYPNLAYILAMSRIIGGFLGVIGSILALVIFSRPEYENCVTMTYHRFINFIEIISGLILIHGGFDTLYQDYLIRYEAWVYTNVAIVLRFRGSMLFMVNMVVLWVACERIAACWATRFFNTVNTKRVAWMVIVLAMLIATACVLPNGFSIDYYFDNSTKTYVTTESALSRTDEFKSYAVFYAVFTLAHSAILLVASIAAVTGFMSMARRKRKLVTSTKTRFQSTSDKELVRQYASSLQLCVLQMCETIPFTINEVIVASYLIQYNYVTVLPSGRTAPWNMPYSKAVDVVKANELSYYMQFINGFGVVVSHCLRFYLYLIFSAKARRAFLALLRIVPSTGGSSNQISPVTVSVAKAQMTSQMG